jgi:hypothetical protein
MSEFIQKHKLHLHITVEVICIIGVFLYLSRKNKSLAQEISFLHERVNAIEHALQSVPSQRQQLSQPVFVATTRAPIVKKKTKQVAVPSIEEVVEDTSSDNDDDDDLDAQIDTELEKMHLLK